MTAIRGTFIITCDEVIRVADAQLIAWFKKVTILLVLLLLFVKSEKMEKGFQLRCHQERRVICRDPYIAHAPNDT